MSSHQKISLLKEQHFIDGFLGDFPINPRPAIVIWAKHEPRHDNLPLFYLSIIATGIKPTIFVDDIAARLFCHRTFKEQDFYNSLYEKFFRGLGSDLVFSSSLYEKASDSILFDLAYQISKTTSASRFIRTLPEKKKSILQDLQSSEIMNMLLELLLFEEASKNSNLLVIRKFTQGIVLTHRKISRRPMSAIVLPQLEDATAIDAYITRLKQRLQ